MKIKPTDGQDKKDAQDEETSTPTKGYFILD